MTIETSLPSPSAAASVAADLSALGDAELVERTRRGDAAAADLLARRCRQPAYLLALQLLRDPDDALDVAQDALLRLFTHLDRLQRGRPVRPWLYAIVRNRARDLMRHRGRRPRAALATDDPEGGVVLVDEKPGPEATTHRHEMQVRVWHALGELSEVQREILVLRDYQDLSYQEIAGVLRVPLGTVMSRLHRARKALRERLENAAGGPSHE
jgi:RNA polymerase sigma-70 factor (ECF subfamily)